MKQGDPNLCQLTSQVIVIPMVSSEVRVTSFTCCCNLAPSIYAGGMAWSAGGMAHKPTQWNQYCYVPWKNALSVAILQYVCKRQLFKCVSLIFSRATTPIHPSSLSFIVTPPSPLHFNLRENLEHQFSTAVLPTGVPHRYAEGIWEKVSRYIRYISVLQPFLEKVLTFVGSLTHPVISTIKLFPGGLVAPSFPIKPKFSNHKAHL